MKDINLRIVPAVLSVLIGMVSCVYPFEIDTVGEGGVTVIQGDILIGEYTTVRVSQSAPVSQPSLYEMSFSYDISVLDDRGTEYKQEKITDKGYVIDTRDADPDRLYKLRVKHRGTGRTYESPLQPVNRPAVIDSLSYTIDESKSYMNLAISLHSDNDKYFKWSYTEDWEHHAFMEAKYIYIPPKTVGYQYGQPIPDGPGQIVPVNPQNQTYRCWSHSESSNIMLFSTENQTENRLVNLKFSTIDWFDRRISYIYHIAVQVETLTEEAYRYWDTVRNNSDFTGSLFTPTPSVVTGNISCLEDPSEIVYGYINVAQRSIETMYILNSKTEFFKDTEVYNTELHKGVEWFIMYMQSNAWRPYDGPDPNDMRSVEWINRKCVDCTMFGGSTKGRPDFWAY